MASQYPVTFWDLVEFLVLAVSLPLTIGTIVVMMCFWAIDFTEWLHERNERISSERNRNG